MPVDERGPYSVARRNERCPTCGQPMPDVFVMQVAPDELQHQQRVDDGDTVRERAWSVEQTR